MALTMTDDEAITVAMLHSDQPIEQSGDQWFVGATGPYHPVEEANYKAAGDWGFDTREKLARAYCEHFNIGW